MEARRHTSTPQNQARHKEARQRSREIRAARIAVFASMLKQQDGLVQQQAILQGELQKTAREIGAAARDIVKALKRRPKPK